MKRLLTSRLWVVFIFALFVCGFATIANSENLAPLKNLFAERPLVHILGPSPAIVPSAEKSKVDSFIMESCDVLKDNDTY